MVKTFIALVVSVALLIFGVPFTLLGILGICGSLPEMSRLDSLQSGLICLTIAAISLGSSLTLSWYVNWYGPPSRFSVRSLMVGVTMIAVVLGLLNMLQAP
jgi:hypothetical protein